MIEADLKSPSTERKDSKRRLRPISSRPLVTALICNYNYGRYLADSIESALNQTWRPLEVVVVDDGSTDCSREILSRYEDRIRVVLKENGGQASAFNLGIAAGRGEIICFLDSDDVWLPAKVSTVVAKFFEDDYGLVCHDYSVIDGTGQVLSPAAAGLARGEISSGDLRGYVQRHGFPWVFSPTSGLSLRSEIARILLPIPEAQWRICADAPLAYGAVWHAAVGAIPERLARYRYHGKNGFAVARQEAYQGEIIEFIQSAKRYIYSRDHLARFGTKPAASPMEYYPFYRKWCFVVRGSAWQVLLKLWKKNYIYHSSGLHRCRYCFLRFLRFLVVDSLLTVVVPLGLSGRYRKLRHQFRLVMTSLDVETYDYLTTKS